MTGDCSPKMQKLCLPRRVSTEEGSPSITVEVRLTNWSSQRGRRSLFSLRGCGFAVGSSDPSAPGQQLNDQHDQRHHQDEVNQPTGHVESEPEEPKDDEDDNNCVEHM